MPRKSVRRKSVRRKSVRRKSVRRKYSKKNVNARKYKKRTYKRRTYRNRKKVLRRGGGGRDQFGQWNWQASGPELRVELKKLAQESPFIGHDLPTNLIQGKRTALNSCMPSSPGKPVHKQSWNFVDWFVRVEVVKWLIEAKTVEEIDEIQQSIGQLKQEVLTYEAIQKALKGLRPIHVIDISDVDIKSDYVRTLENGQGRVIKMTSVK